MFFLLIFVILKQAALLCTMYWKLYHLQTFPTHLPIIQKYIIIIHDFLRLAISILSTRELAIWRAPFQVLVQKYRMYSIPDSDRALPKYKFKNTLQSRLLDILIHEDTYVGVRTLIDLFSKY